MERCKTCRHWLPEPTKHDNFGRPRRGYCQLAESNEGSPVHDGSMAVAQDQERNYAYLITSETFGCVQWEGREA